MTSSNTPLHDVRVALQDWLASGCAAELWSPVSEHVRSDLILVIGTFRLTGGVAIDTLSDQEPLVDNAIIARVFGELELCLVCEGTDSITGLRHRDCWVFETVEGKISRIIKTGTTVLERPYDGTFPLRTVDGDN